MDRRELIKHIALLTGATVVGGEFFLSGCKNSENVSAVYFTEKDISFFDEVAETIIPKTNTPGAKDAEVGKFMAFYAIDCYDQVQIKTLKEGISKLDDASKAMNNVVFVDANAEQKHKLLTKIDADAKKSNEQRDQSKKEPPHYFTLMKQLTLLGFFTSKPGASEVLRYVPVPGKYEGCIEYKQGETSWA